MNFGYKQSKKKHALVIQLYTISLNKNLDQKKSFQLALSTNPAWDAKANGNNQIRNMKNFAQKIHENLSNSHDSFSV